MSDLTEAELSELYEASKDDRMTGIVGSDVRCLVAEVRRLRSSVPGTTPRDGLAMAIIEADRVADELAEAGEIEESCGAALAARRIEMLLKSPLSPGTTETGTRRECMWHADCDAADRALRPGVLPSHPPLRASPSPGSETPAGTVCHACAGFVDHPLESEACLRKPGCVGMPPKPGSETPPPVSRGEASDDLAAREEKWRRRAIAVAEALEQVSACEEHRPCGSCRERIAAAFSASPSPGSETPRAEPHFFDKRAADALANEVAKLIDRRVLDTRSPAADALLDYRDGWDRGALGKTTAELGSETPRGAETTNSNKEGER